jgi:hypothetical protein
MTHTQLHICSLCAGLLLLQVRYSQFDILKVAPVTTLFIRFNGHMCDCRQVYRSYIFCVGLHLVQYFEYEFPLF